MTLQPIHSEFPYTVYGENLIFVFISTCISELLESTAPQVLPKAFSKLPETKI